MGVRKDAGRGAGTGEGTLDPERAAGKALERKSLKGIKAYFQLRSK